MNARDSILAAVRRSAPAPTPPPDLSAFAGRGGPQTGGPQTGGVADLAARFVAAVEAAGGRVVEAEAGGAGAAVRRAYPDAERVASATGHVGGAAALDGAPHALADLDLFVCEAGLGVAENGAVWLPESRLGPRVAPFLAPHVAVVLEARSLVPTMHDAYARTEAEGFGVFVAGPSKTADIEQSLVIGAHGPVSLTVVLVG